MPSNMVLLQFFASEAFTPSTSRDSVGNFSILNMSDDNSWVPGKQENGLCYICVSLHIKSDCPLPNDNTCLRGKNYSNDTHNCHQQRWGLGNNNWHRQKNSSGNIARMMFVTSLFQQNIIRTL